MTGIKSLVKEYRKQRHIDQEELAEAVGVCRKTIYLIEKGDRNPTLIIALRLARYFEVPVEQLFWLNDQSFGANRCTEKQEGNRTFSI